ncbi:MAG: cytochrome c maturation protein CcmE [Polyangiaceae bacterium]|jgi:cytochrome c-type biogenesis protein CcmE
MTDEHHAPASLEGHVTDTPVPRRRRGAFEETPRNRWTGPLVAVGLAMGSVSIAALVLTGMQDKAIYSKPVDQLLSQKAKFVGRPVRAEGVLVHGSLEKRDQPCEYRFSISKNGVELPVRFAQCVVPDTFRDVRDIDVGVTVEGELRADDSFEATSVLAKCPSKYEMQERKSHGEDMPHGPLAAEPWPGAARAEAR